MMPGAQVEDAKATIVIVQRGIMERAEKVVEMANAAAGGAGGSTVSFLVIEDFWAGPAKQMPSTNPGPRAEPHNLAYIIFTSGSTGEGSIRLYIVMSGSWRLRGS